MPHSNTEYAKARKLSHDNEKLAKESSEGFSESAKCAQSIKNAMPAYQSSNWSEAISHFNDVMSKPLTYPIYST